MPRAAFVLFVVFFATVSCKLRDRVPDQPVRQDDVATFRVPGDSEITNGDVLASVRRGRALMRHTRDSLPGHVGSKLDCSSCHLLEGTQKSGIPLVGVYARFPQYRTRTARVDLIEDRINDCFERSLNGKALDVKSTEMRDLVAYVAFLSRGIPTGSKVDGQGVWMIDPLPGDSARGAALFATTCTICHGPDGQGTAAAPPLWGPHSFNMGASMARIRTAAGFIHSAMPMSKPGTLTPQQAFDLAAYVTSHSRPDFAKKELDFPRGDPPPDMPYPIRSTSGKTKAR